MAQAGSNGSNGNGRLSDDDFSSFLAGYARSPARSPAPEGQDAPDARAPTDPSPPPDAPPPSSPVAPEAWASLSSESGEAGRAARPASAPAAERAPADASVAQAAAPEPPPPAPAPRQPSRRVTLRLDQVLVLAADNASRGGMEWTARHREVRELADTVAATGRLLEPPCVRPLPSPIPRPPEDVSPGLDGLCGSPAWTHRLVFGFKRVAALRIIGWQECEFEERDLDDDEAAEACLVENAARSDPTDYEVAMALAEAQQRYGMQIAALSRRTGIRVDKAESLARIARRCPPALLDMWRASPTPRVRGDLDRVSRIEGRDERETHRLMLDEWSRLRAERDLAEGRARGRDGKRGPRTTPRTVTEMQGLRAELDQASEWYDPARCMWRPLSEDAREVAQALLRYASTRSSGRRPPLR